MVIHMDIIVIRHGKPCLRKTVEVLSHEVQENLRLKLRIQTNPNSAGLSDVRTGSEIKTACANINDLVDANLKLRGLVQELMKVEDEDLVVLVDGSKFRGMDIFNWMFSLGEMKKGGNVVDSYWRLKRDLDGVVDGRYDTMLFRDFGFDQYFGEWDKSNRVCRFCHDHDVEGEKKSIFGIPKNSHAISYFLGNDRLFCLEECKECNERFGRTIETDLANYYNYYRAAEGRKSREGKDLTAKGFNFEYSKGKMSIYSDKLIENQPTVGEKMPEEGILLHLKNEDPVNLHNIYKVLVKYVIACIPNDLLSNFNQTIKWINGEIIPKKHLLPPVYRIETLENVHTPSLCVYVRRDDKKDLPYCVGEIRFFENLYVFAVPYCKGRDIFMQDLHKPFETFIQKRYDGLNFTIENFCDDEPKMITTHVKLEGGGDDVLQPMDPESIKVGEEWWKKRNAKMMKRFGTTELPD